MLEPVLHEDDSMPVAFPISIEQSKNFRSYRGVQGANGNTAGHAVSGRGASA